MTTSDPRTTGMNRRTLVKAGAVAAWTVPVVSAVVAAPAYASTSGSSSATPSASLSSPLPATGSGKTVIDIGSFSNGSTPTGTLTITFTLVNPVANYFTGATVTPGTGWVVTVTPTTVTFTHAPLAAGESTPTATFTATVHNSGEGTIVATWDDSATTANPDGTLFTRAL